MALSVIPSHYLMVQCVRSGRGFSTASQYSRNACCDEVIYGIVSYLDVFSLNVSIFSQCR